MVKVVIGNKLCSFEELLEEYWKICKENEALRKEIFGSASEIDKFFEENISLKKQIAELESELSVKEDLVKIKNALCEEEPLPFSDEQYEEDLIKELEDRHQQDFITINQLHTTIDTLVDRYAKLRRDL